MLGLSLELSLGTSAATKGGVEPFPLPGSSIDFDFKNARYSGGDLSQFTITRASPATDLLPTSPVGAAYKTYAVNEIRIVPKQGFLVEETRTRYNSDVLAPGTETINLAVGLYTLWVNGPGSASIAAATARLSPAGAVENGNGDRRSASGASALQGVPIYFHVMVAGTVTLTKAGTLYAVQLEGGLGATSYIPGAGSGVVRVGDSNVSTSGSIFSATGNIEGTVVTTLRSLDSMPYLGAALKIDAVVMARDTADHSGFGANNQGGNNAFFALGRGRFKTGAKIALTWDASGRTIGGNGGIASLSTKLLQTTHVGVRIGQNALNSQVANALIERISILPVKTAPATARALSGPTNFDAILIGDSLADGQGVMRNIPALLSQLTGRKIMNAGASGDSSAQSLARFQAAGDFDKPLITFVGINDRANPTQVQNSIASMIASLTHTKFIVLGVPTYFGEQTGSSGANASKLINDALATAYGTRYLDTIGALLAAYDPADPYDVFCRDNGMIPQTLRRRSWVQTPLWLAADITDTATSFTVSSSGALTANNVYRIGTEYIQVLAVSGANVTSCTRGYAGSSAAAHAQYDLVDVWDNIHFDGGYAVLANAIKTEIDAQGWFA